ncbi:protein PHOX4-like [Andrographis paniculata]|uniref:protein PHOX4-like n=1 Tax=Andrographis paniculata TaxID=175694 RepID=UPI0021E8CEA9|nr:protein PHOX4-like [Andrographis paniculata]
MRRNSIKERVPRKYADRWRELSLKQIRANGNGNGNGAGGGYDADTAMFMSMAQELKEEGNRLFLRRDYQGAIVKYEKSIKLLPNNHADVAYVRSNMAECYMQLGGNGIAMAIDQCNLALEVIPAYSKALLKRARCYEALERPDFALADVVALLDSEPNNLMAAEIEQRLRKKTTTTLPLAINNLDEKHKEEEEEAKRTVKLVFGEDIRWAQVPLSCDILKLRQIIADRYPYSRAILIKYTDQEGDMVTITTTQELRWVESESKLESSSRSTKPLKLYIVEVDPDEDPLYDKLKRTRSSRRSAPSDDENEEEEEEEGHVLKGEPTCITDWIIQFAQFFKSYLGLDIDAYIDIHQIGIKLYSEAVEETVTSDEAQDLLGAAADKFVEMAALALLNSGNAHMSRTRKKVYAPQDSSRLERIQCGYDWAQRELAKAGKRYEQAIKIKDDFYEAVLAQGQQQFEQAKLSWYYAVATGVEPPGDVLLLYCYADEKMERGMRMWEKEQQRRISELWKTNKMETLLQRMKLDSLFKEVSAEEMEEQDSSIQSQIYVLWGTILYERSTVEYKLEMPAWQDCLDNAVNKFDLAGASETDIAVMVKNHCSNNTSSSFEGFGFNIDEIVQAWDEMYEAKKWQHNIPSFRLEPVLRRRISKLYYALERL